jgi:antibiotic biosynthesis monooxygenase (ABM) superfamily enzyme
LCVWRLGPLGLQAYEQWHKNQNSPALSHLVICSIFALCFLFFVGIGLTNAILILDEILPYAFGFARFIYALILTYIISYFTVPKTVNQFSQWKETKKTKHFSKALLYGTLSAYLFLAILILFVVNK